MIESRLRIHNVSETEFAQFRDKYLKEKELSDEAIKEIANLFSFKDNSSISHRLNCKEKHTHDYGCLEFNNPETEVVYRLMIELSKSRDACDDLASSLHGTLEAYFKSPASRAGPINMG
ncbi:MAG: hypothetical protein AABW51_04070 [Nanoarchaeota archaeon]